MSGMPDASIAERFDELHRRVGTVGQNILDRMDKGFARVDKEFGDVKGRLGGVETELGNVKTDLADFKTSVDRRFTDVEREISDVKLTMNEHFTEVDDRFTHVDTRLNLLQTDMTKVTQLVQTIHNDNGLRDLRIDKVEKRLDTIETLLVRIDAKLPEEQPN
ncbi:hypothetical protein [Nonomuraea rubra]